MWSTGGYALLATSSLDQSIHELAWDPFAAYEFTLVGAGVSFWLFEEGQGQEEEEEGGGAGRAAGKLKFHEPAIPNEIRETSPVSGLWLYLAIVSVCQSLLGSSRRARWSSLLSATEETTFSSLEPTLVCPVVCANWR